MNTKYSSGPGRPSLMLFPAIAPGAHIHVFAMEVPGVSECTHRASAERHVSVREVVVACFDQRTDYMVARIGARPAFAMTPAVVRNAILDLESYRAHVEVIVDHHDLVGAGYAGEPEFVRQVRPLIFRHPPAASVASIRIQRHRDSLMRAVMWDRPLPLSALECALAAFVNDHNCIRAHEMLGGMTPVDMLVKHRSGADRAKEA